MKPSNIILVGIPLVATFGKSEIEWAVAIVVRTCQDHGDTWQPVGWEQIQKTLRTDMQEGKEPFCSLMRNPFFKPNIHLAIDAGVARWTDKPNGPVELTPAGLAKLVESRWYREEAAA